MLHLVTFGGLALESVNEAVAPRLSAQRLAILAVLAAEGDRRVSRERLTGLFWPDADEDRARHSLRQALYALRTELRREVVRSDFALSLEPGVITSDVAEFRAALARGDRPAAGALVRGPFLAGFYLPSAAPFQRWVEDERSRLHTLATGAITSLATDAVAAHDLEGAVRWWRQLTELDPLSGRFALGYITALAARGDRAEALAFARAHTVLVRRELETEPDAEVRRLETSLRSAAPAPSTGGSASPMVAPAAPAPGVSSGVDTPRSTASRPLPAPRRRGPARLTRILLAAGAVAVVGIVTRMVLHRPADDASAAATTPVLAVGVIADHGLDSVGAGGVLTDMLSTNLASIPGLRVIASSRLMELIPEGRDTSAAAYWQAARRAGATELLEGRLVDRSSDAFTLELRRVDLRTGILKGAYRVSAPTRFRLIDSITAVVTRSFALVGPSVPPADVTTRSATAYRLYLEGLRSYYRPDYATARQMMRAALEDDSTFAMAAYYDALLTDSPASSAPANHALRLAERASDRERLIITVDVASYLLGSPAALAAADTLARRYPDDGRALAAVARARKLAGDWAGAAAALHRAIAVDSAALGPASPCYLCEDLASLTDVYFWWDSLGAAARVARRYTELRPDLSRPWELVMWASAKMGDTTAARDALHKATSLSTASRFLPLEARIKLLLGQYDAIEQDLRVLLASPKREDFLEARWWILIALRNQGRLHDAGGLIEAGMLPGFDPPQVANVPDDVSEGVLAFERGDARTARAIFEQIWARPLAGGLAEGQAARYHAWRGTLAGMAIAATGDTAAVLRLADSVEYWGQRSIYGRDRRAHHYLRGLVHAAAGRDDEAIRELRSAIYSPSLGFTRVNLELGRVLLRRNRAREAVEVILPALRGEVDASNLYVTRTELHELLGRAYDTLGMRDSAAVHYRAVVRAWEKADPIFRARREKARGWLAAHAR